MSRSPRTSTRTSWCGAACAGQSRPTAVKFPSFHSSGSGLVLPIGHHDESAAPSATTKGANLTLDHKMMGPPGWRCSCGKTFDDYYASAAHIRLSINCPRCGATPSAALADGEVDRWQCGHWIACGDFSATIRDANETLDHYPTHGLDANHVTCACGHTEPVGDDFTAALKRVNEHVHAVRR